MQIKELREQRGQPLDKYPDQSWKAVVELAQPREVEEYLVDEIFRALGCKMDSRWRRWFGWVLKPSVRGFARRAAAFDRSVANQGFQCAAQEVLQQWIPDLRLIGADRLPLSGPLLIAANHPGTFDALAIASALRRPDLKIITAANPFFRSIPNTRHYFIYSTLDPDVRVATIRNAVSHLRSGGALLFFPSGKLDPDPQYYTQRAKQALLRWSGSMALFIKKTPDIRLVIAINSGFVAPGILQSPIVRILSKDENRQKVAEFVHVILRVVFNQRVACRPRVRLGEIPAPHSTMVDSEDFQAQLLALASNFIDLNASTG